MNNKIYDLMNLTRILLLPFIATLLFATRAHSQNFCEELTLPTEHVTLQLDRNVFLAGETIWFKAWCFIDGHLREELSKVLYVEIFDETKKAIVQEKFPLQNNSAVGSILIPEDAPSKYYFLRAYTRYMRNFSSDDFHYQQITIVNPLIEGGRVEAVDSENENGSIHSSAIVPSGPAQFVPIQIIPGAESVQPGENIDFQIKSEAVITADLSATIRLKGLGNHPNEHVFKLNPWLMPWCHKDEFCRVQNGLKGSTSEHTFSHEKSDEPIRDFSDLEWLPETRGLTISGIIRNENQENVPNTMVLTSVVQNEPLIHAEQTNEEGSFTMCLQNMMDKQTLFVGTADASHTVLVKNDFHTDYPDIRFVPLQFDKALHRLLKDLYVNLQLKREYPIKNTQAVFKPDSLPLALINLVAPDRITRLADFVKMNTMSEVFREIIPGLAMNKKNGEDNLSVYNYDLQKWYDSPLVLIDHVPVFNITELLTIDPLHVDRVDVFHSEYFLGDHRIRGIISIVTKTDNFANYEWGEQASFTNYKGYATSRVFDPVSSDKDNHLPDFRPVVYWQPRLNLTEENSGETISISAPDKTGSYEILIQGYTHEGHICYGYITFEVF